jgi:(2Fe-2S) ferredoxin
VTAADVDEIIDSHIIGGQPVERLRLADSCINTSTCEHKPRKLSDQILETPLGPGQAAS